MAHYEVKLYDNDNEPIVVEADGFELYADANPISVLFHNNVARDVDSTTQTLYGLGVSPTTRRHVSAYVGIRSVREVQV